MDKLETLICDSVGKAYSCIQDGDAVIVPCYLITPYGVGTLKGNGMCVEQTLQCEVCFFVDNKAEHTDHPVDNLRQRLCWHIHFQKLKSSQ